MSEIYSYTVLHSGVNTTYYFEDTDLRSRIADAEAYVGYTDNDIAGLEVDYENNTFTRLAGAVGKSGGSDFNVFPTYAGMRRCILADDGTVVAYYGDSGYVEDGSAGQVMVEIPKFYYKVVPMKLQKQIQEGENDTNRKGYHLLKARYYISATPKTGFKVHPVFINRITGNIVDYVYIGAYGAIVYDVSESKYLLNNEQVADVTASTGDKLSSVNIISERQITYYNKTQDEDVTITVNCGPKPASGETANNALTRVNCTKLAHNRGTGWEQETVEMVSAIHLLFGIEYCSLNGQTSIGAGVTSITDNGKGNCGSFIGSTASLGNGSGAAASTIDYMGTTQTTNGRVSISYRGIEDFWGNLWKFAEGLAIWGDGTMGGGAPYICTDGVYTENRHDQNYDFAGFTLANIEGTTSTSGYIRYFGYGKEEYDWLFLASKVQAGATSSLPVGDYEYTTTGLNGYRVAYRGGGWAYGGFAGPFCWFLIYGVGTRYRYVGARLCRLPLE